MPPRTTVPLAKDDRAGLQFGLLGFYITNSLQGKPPAFRHDPRRTTGTWKSAARAWEVIETIVFICIGRDDVTAVAYCSTVACLLNSAASVALWRR